MAYTYTGNSALGNLQAAGLINQNTRGLTPEQLRQLPSLSQEQIGGLTNTLNDYYSAQNDWNTNGLAGLEKQYAGLGGNPESDGYIDWIKGTKQYQDISAKEKAAQSALQGLNPMWKSGGNPNGALSNEQVTGLLGSFKQPTKNSTGFLDKAGGVLSKAIPAGAAIGAGAILGPALVGATPMFGALGGTATGAATGSTGGFFSGLMNLPSTVSTALGDGTLGAIGSGAVKGGVVGGLSSGLTGGKIGQGILSGALTGGALGGAGHVASDALSGTSLGEFLGVQPNITSADKAFLGSARAASGSSPSALSTLGKALGFGGGGSSSLGGNNGMGTLATLLGGYNDYTANKRALKDLTAAGQQATNMLSPYMQSGAQANSRLADMLGISGNTGAEGYGSLNTPITAESIQDDPGYQFTVAEGNKALDRRAAAGGGYFSGAALKQASKYNTGIANTYLNDASQRDLAQKSALYSMLSGQSGTGLNAANAGAGYVTDIGSAKAGAGIQSANNINSILARLFSGNSGFSFA